jgi:tRNA 2-thiouridine synthesizing protein B
MTLHIVSTSPFGHGVFESLFTRCSKNDGIMLIQDGVYALNHVGIVNQLTQIQQTLDVACFVLKDDLTARANKAQPTNTDTAIIKWISMDDFVALTLNYKTTISW